MITDNLKNIEASIPADCTLVAVSKTKPEQAIKEAYEAGHRDFGENKVQELAEKAEHLPNDIHWHMIGHLQRNKVKYIAPFVYLIHGVDSFRLLREINKQGQKNNRIIDCLLQMHIAEEDTKFGLDKNELMEILEDDTFAEMKHVRIRGLMGMATFTDDTDQIRREFRLLKGIYDQVLKISHTNLSVNVLSMGMSGDYQVAIEEGSNMVRIGSAIFGERAKKQ